VGAEGLEPPTFAV